MTALDRLGLHTSDFSEPVESDEQLIHEVMTSGRLYRRAMHHIILQKLREYFENDSLQKSDPLDELFPLKGRRKKWHRFQMDFDMIVPMLGAPIPIIVLLVIYAAVVIYYIFVGISFLTPFDVMVLIITKSIGVIGYLAFMAFILPVGLIGIFGFVRLPGQTVDDLVEAILVQNMKDLFVDDRLGLKLLLQEQLLK